LNASLSNGYTVTSEVFVRFDCEEKPDSIICNEYDIDSKRCRLRELTRENNQPIYGQCIFSSWKKL